MFLALCMSVAVAMPALAAEMGEDGLHKQPWFSVTFRDVGEDLADAKDEGKRLALIFEQRGCVYCAKLHKEVLSRPEVAEVHLRKFHGGAVQPLRR